MTSSSNTAVRIAAGGGDDVVVEHRGADRSDGPFVAIGEAMAAVRGGGEAAGEEALREATMRQAIRRAERDGAVEVAVVCGAWHVPALSAAAVGGAGEAKRDAAMLRGLASTKVAMTWVPWTERRLASGSGYGAGVSSPGWYAHVFAHPGPAGVTRWFARVAAMLRAEDHAVSPDHVVGAIRLAEALATLRGRPQAGLAELTDAAAAVIGDGRVGPLALIHERLVVGTALGGVPPQTPMVPLARDLAATARRLRLKQEASKRTLELDLRVGAGLGRSHLLHRLWALDVAWGRPVEARQSSGTFRETWELRWDPELEVRLIDASSYGTTLVAAATARLLERCAVGDPSRQVPIGELSATVELALLADLPDALAPLLERLATLTATEPDVVGLIDALGPLARILRYGDVRSIDAGGLGDVIDGLAVRITAGLFGAVSGLDDEGATQAATRLTATQAALALIGHPILLDGWPRALTAIAGDRAAGPTVHGLVRGRAVRLLIDAQHWTTDEGARWLSRALSAGTPPASGAAFVEGFLGGSGTVLLHDTALLGLVDGWLSRLPAGAFGDIVALLRRTFGAFEMGERHRIGELVAGRGDGRHPAPFGWDLDPARAAAAAHTVRTLLGVR